MTIQTPISNPGIAGLAPPGLPDVATLSQLANAFFASLPGETPELDGPRSAGPDLAGAGSPTGAAASRGEPAGFGGGAPVFAPAIEPAQFGAAVPPAPAAVSPQFGRSLAPALPAGFEAALPLPERAAPLQSSGQPAGAPASPYYFVGESSAYHSSIAPAASPAAAPAVAENRVQPQPYDLPGTADLAGSLDASHVPPLQAQRPSAGPAAGQFYFLDAGAAPRIERLPDGAPQVRSHGAFDVEAVRRDFPILAERVGGKPLVWLDNAATTQKPQAVIDRLAWFYAHENSNIHRAAHELAARATDAYEGARGKVARFIGARSAEEIVFVRGATEAINLVANTFGRQYIGEGDEIVVSLLEHHANIVPWQQLAAATGAKIRVIPVDDSGQILLDEYRKLLNPRTRLVAVTQVSNALGTITPVAEIVALAHAAGARVLVDGAQSVSHLRVDVRTLDADFFVFSGHKIFGPTGIGVLYGKAELLDALPPWQGGGNMIADVAFDKTLYQKAPARFEAGTGNIADAVGLGAALDYLERLGLENVARYEHDLLSYATYGLQRIPGVRLIGTAAQKTSVASFVLAGYSTAEVGSALSREGIAVRSGHHCAQPILRRFGLEATVRPSLAFYNTCGEIDALLAVVNRLARGRGSVGAH
ncbi:family 2A encapsulin nanocompartment cargo protein cysteine desulfurase [Chitinimonas koreensis]|uniref:family 2A encapsulin nanocompartment cargo protein cysteine desulfurase n=1 Tax=Chitinimonas koreensis TaxID=356302 RepID=UPI00041A2A2A|nr:family 2A encapsulin nanocompartment cargo protein cysteine desulfurase [Chitinimonas koreensis]